jgi:hypothetical protein
MQNDDAFSLACCISRAERISGKSKEDTGNEVYWYTRERCFELASVKGIKFSSILGHIKMIEWVSFKDIISNSEDFWPLVAHPLVIMSEVSSS